MFSRSARLQDKFQKRSKSPLLQSSRNFQHSSSCAAHKSELQRHRTSSKTCGISCETPPYNEELPNRNGAAARDVRAITSNKNISNPNGLIHQILNPPTYPNPPPPNPIHPPPTIPPSPLPDSPWHNPTCPSPPPPNPTRHPSPRPPPRPTIVRMPTTFHLATGLWPIGAPTPCNPAGVQSAGN